MLFHIFCGEEEKMDSISCSKCEYVIGGGKETSLSHIDWQKPCSHSGFTAEMLMLLLRKRELLLFTFFPRRFLIPAHIHLWPFPFWDSYKSLLSCIKWAETAFYSNIEKIDDDDMFELCFKRGDITISSISKERGFGIVALNNIRKGERIGLYSGKITPFSWRRGSSSSRYIASYPTWLTSIFPFCISKWIINANEAGSVLRYLNHSEDTPSVGYKMLFWRGIPLISIVTMRNIEKGEEIVINYGYSPV